MAEKGAQIRCNNLIVKYYGVTYSNLLSSAPPLPMSGQNAYNISLAVNVLTMQVSHERRRNSNERAMPLDATRLVYLDKDVVPFFLSSSLST